VNYARQISQKRKRKYMNKCYCKKAQYTVVSDFLIFVIFFEARCTRFFWVLYPLC